MPIFTAKIPLSLYVHTPWCVQKCPYCDFNSHELKSELQEELYINALIDELDRHADTLSGRPIISIFIGGGTPSLFSSQAIGRLLEHAAKVLNFVPDIEITMEANPGTVDQKHFSGYRSAGVNRLSIGIQSLDNAQLKKLGRIHDRGTAIDAVKIAEQAGFDNFNIDIMYGLPEQTTQEALLDLSKATALGSTHLSWYQLTIEPNTIFYSRPPLLPKDDALWEMQLEGQALLADKGFQQYEVSAYAQPQRRCTHNLNYWQFGDYLGIGAGAHSKITHADGITRFAQRRHPKDYLNAEKRHALKVKQIDEKDIVFEFMLNALRLIDGVPMTTFEERTGLSQENIQQTILMAQEKGLLEKRGDILRPSKLGHQFLNDLMGMFLA